MNQRLSRNSLSRVGASTRRGLATAKQFVNEGAYVFITGRRESELAAAVKDVGRNITGVRGDVSNLDDLDRVCGELLISVENQ